MLGTLAVLSSLSLAQVDPASGIDFVTVGAVGNAPWAGDGTLGDRAIGRGGVDYEYRIGKYEVTTANWVEFMNAALDRPLDDRLPHVRAPQFWGAAGAPPQNGGQRFTVPAGNELRSVGDISWRAAAMYCNWLHNGKSLEREAFLNGAYDVSTFVTIQLPNGAEQFQDQFTRSPGAKYFIPSWDEWLKASHYDPNKQNSDGSVGGWWRYSNGTDIPLTYAPPPSFGGNGTGMANAGFTLPGGAHYRIPLGSYPQTQTPWGLLDVAGCTFEWTEGVSEDPQTFERWRIVDGSFYGTDSGVLDRIGSRGGELPFVDVLFYGVRIASVVPSPASGALGICTLIFVGTRRRRSTSYAQEQMCLCHGRDSG